MDSRALLQHLNPQIQVKQPRTGAGEGPTSLAQEHETGFEAGSSGRSDTRMQG